jgi:hypothetical protein
MKKSLLRIVKSGVAWGFAGMIVRLATAGTLLPLMTRLVSPDELGYWYLFTSFFTMIVVLDLGITTTTGRTLSRLLSTLELEKSEASRQEVADYLGATRAIYAGLTLLSFASLSCVGGWWIWCQTAHTPAADIVRAAWLLACPVFLLAVLANFGRVLLVASNQLNIFQCISTCAFALQGVLSVGGLLGGFGMRALVLANLGLFGVLSLALFLAHLRPQRLVLAGKWGGISLHKVREILKTSLGTFANALATYTVLNANILLASHFLPIATIASYGLSLQIALICSQVGVVWLEMKQPHFAHWAKAEPATLRSVFLSRLRLAILTYWGAVICAMSVGSFLLALIGAHTSLFPPGQFLLLAFLIFVVTHHSQFEALCMCLGHNPFIPAYLISAIVGALLAILLGRRLGSWAFIIGPLAAQLIWNSWWVTAKGLCILSLSPLEYLRCLINPFRKPILR